MLLNNCLKISQLGVMVDCSRGAVLKVETVKRLVDYLSKFGYTYLMLYTEDTYEIENEPYFGQMRGRFSKSEFQEIEAYCKSRDIELVPCIETLAHLGRLLRHGTYNKLFEIDDIFIVNDNRVYEFIDKMFKQISETFSTKRIHIGMDEAWKLGRGKYLDINGYQRVNQIMEIHLKRVSEIASKYGFECTIWADMVRQGYNENPDNFHLNLPSNITPMQWRYCPIGVEETDKEIALFNRLCGNRLSYAGAVTKWIGFVPDNGYSFVYLKEQIEACIKYGISDYLVTAWGDGAADASIFSILPGIYYAALKAHGLDLNSETKAYFNEVVGVSFDDFMLVDLPNHILGHKTSNCNLSFMHLYNDVLQSPLYEIEGDYRKAYLSASRKLSKLNNEFSYIFEPLSLLCKVNAYKCNLGKRLYESYKSNDNSSLVECKKDIKLVMNYLKKFMASYENQWHIDNKSFGYEKQSIRLGGLLERLSYVLRRIDLYVNGDISQIEELEEEHIVSDFFGRSINPCTDIMNSYVDLVSGGSLRDF